MKGSYSFQVREAVARLTLEDLGVLARDRGRFLPCCAASFLRAVFLCLGRIEEDEIVLTAGSQGLLEICAMLSIRFFDCEANVVSRGKTGYSLRLPRRFAKDILSGGKEESCVACPKIFLRAAFLSCGTVLDPEKGYHAALRVPSAEAEMAVLAAASEVPIPLRASRSGSGVLVYVKKAEDVADFLTAIGAEQFSMNLSAHEVLKSGREMESRRNNFENANRQRAVDGAQAVIADIRYLSKKGVLGTLSEPLQETARVRLEHPEADLKELCLLMPGAIGKSGLYHRLQKLSAIAREAREGEK